MPMVLTRTATIESESVDDECSLLSGSQFTHSTSSTIHGPGALAGKAIKALGKFTLSGVDRFIIYARIKTILPRFPHTDEQVARIKDIDEAYDIILELSRPGLYAEDIRKTALTLILYQIGSGHTVRLIQALSRWNVVELEIFMSGLVYHTTSFINFDPFYRKYPLPSPLSRDKLIRLMADTIQTSRRACRAVLDAQFFEVFASIDEDGLLPSDLAQVYRAITHISRSESQHEEPREEALRLLAVSMSHSRPSFVMALMEWDAEELRTLVEIFFRRFAPSWYSKLKGSDKTLTDDKEGLPDVNAIQAMMHFLCRGARLGDKGCLKVVRAGYLDILITFRGRERAVHWERIDKEFNIALTILRQSDFVYTEVEIDQTVGLLLCYIDEGYGIYIHHALAAWGIQELDYLLALLVKELRSLVASQKTTAISRLTTFITETASQNCRTCDTVISAGLYDTLRLTTEEDNSSVKNMILGILMNKNSYTLETMIRTMGYVYHIFNLTVPSRWDAWSYLDSLCWCYASTPTDE